MKCSRTSPLMRLRKMPAATRTAERPMESERRWVGGAIRSLVYKRAGAKAKDLCTTEPRRRREKRKIKDRWVYYRPLVFRSVYLLPFAFLCASGAPWCKGLLLLVLKFI